METGDWELGIGNWELGIGRVQVRLVAARLPSSAVGCILCTLFMHHVGAVCNRMLAQP